MTSSLWESSVPTATSWSSGFQTCVRFASISVTRALPRRPRPWPSLVASTRPPAPPPTITMWWRPAAATAAGARLASASLARASASTASAASRSYDVVAAMSPSPADPLWSAHRRHDEVGPGPDAGRPAGRDRLQPGVEAHALGTVHVVVAEQRALPAAEAVEGHRHRDRDVDAHHPDLDLVREVARRVAVAGEDRGAVGEGVGVDDPGRRLVVRRPDDR